MSADINLNTASADEFATLPGIGETLAARIVAHREQVGAFERVDDLLAINGITERILDGIRRLVDVGRGDDTPKQGPPNKKPPRPNGDGDDRDDGDETVGPGKHHGGDPVRIHEEYVRHHLGGETQATAETYERAREQFRRLPGAVQRPPAQVRFEPSEERPDDESDENAE